MRKSFFIITLSFFVFYGIAQNIYTYCGNGNSTFGGDGGPATLAQVGPEGITVDASGNLYIVDISNSRIRKVNPAGIINTIAGTGTLGFSGDGGPATSADFSYPVGVALDGSGNIYIADQGNNRIRKINTSGIISTIAGTGATGYSGDGASATSAQLSAPCGITVDALNNIYFSDRGNNCVRKINSAGIINTIAGTGVGGFSGDGGPATSAKLNAPFCIAVDASGNIYIADTFNSRIRKVSSSGTISTIAGIAFAGFSGDGGPATSAKLNFPAGIAIDPSGNIYIAEQQNQRIRKINTSGIINTIIGTGSTGFSGDAGPAILANIYNPSGVVLDALGNIYICDAQNFRIRIVCVTNCLAGVNEWASKINFKIYPNPVSNTLHIELEQYFGEGSAIEITNTLCQTVLKLPYKNEIDVSLLSKGCYVLKIATSDKQQFYSKFIKD